MIALDGAGQWRRSSYSGANGNCVEVADLPDGVRAVRDSKDTSGAAFLTFNAGEWSAFVAEIKTRRHEG